jgi:hypothetical protein
MKHTGIKIITQIILSILAIIGLFILQFKSGKTFSLNLGAISVAGRYDTVGSKTVPILPVQVVANGISFFVSERDSITADEIADGKKITTRLEVLQYSNTEKSFTVHCSQDVSITFAYDKFGDIEVLNITAQMPETVSEVSVPWKIAANAKFEIKNKKSLIFYNKKHFQFEGNFGFNEMGIIDTNIEQPRLVLEREKTASAKYISYVESREFSIESVASMTGCSEEEYNTAKENFANLSLSVLREQINRKTYNEQTIATYIAEMARRNMYLNALKTAPENSLSKNARTELTMPFYGNTINMFASVLQEENAQRNKLSKLISERSVSVFETPNLIAYLVDRNSSVLISDLPAILNGSDLSKITLTQAIGIVECFSDYAEYFPKQENFFEKSLETCFRKIKDSFTVIDNNLYVVQTNDKQSFIDTLLSIRLSKILMRVTATSWKPVAYKVFTSVYSLIGADGSLAQTYNVVSNGKSVGLVVDDSEILNAAKLYPYIITNNWYPSAKSFHTAEHGMWVYGSAQNISVIDHHTGYVRFAVEGVRDGAEYMVIRNVKRLKTIIIYGLEYRSDNRFETYNSSGYVYNEATATLYLKLKHKQDIEEITLTYVP